ncbi:MAG: sigma-54 dependent transcriptional regulator [Rhodobacter sp.]|nr:sigma-54 dependent transcriptional regulator [Rhodobacter sp.]MCY4169403.1 sigma-54 dependent transcriptional regulator [Rhodobacter sp.]MCY4241761.1 sigma-54 dependent transcriptional regulator [Rhodobacter sp.]
MGEILIVDDEKDIRELVSDILKDEGYATRLAANSMECMAAIEGSPPALIILDIWLRDSEMDGIEILKAVKANNPGIPVIIISGHGNIELAVAAIKQGAYDFIEKPFNIDQLTVVIARAMETSRLRSENLRLKHREETEFHMIGDGAAFRTFRSKLDKVLDSNARVMLAGPSGCGKEVAARYLHFRSGRTDAPFVAINCATIEPERMEEVLFGREGAGARPGLLEQANGGTIYLADVADMPVGTQSKILRVLVEQAYRRLGGSHRVRVNARVISGTSRNLEEEIAAGRFREELYHRLSVVPVSVPSLERRLEDIPLLAAHFVELFHRTQGLPKRVFSEDAALRLQCMPWPGNVRQLRNVIERVLILGEGDGPVIASELLQAEEGPPPEERVLISGELASSPLRDARVLFEKEYLKAQINRFEGNVSRTAKFIGMERSALHRKLRNLGISTSDR